MATRIWKLPLEVTDEQSVEMPSGAKLLHVNMQAGSLHVWAQVDTNAEKVRRTVHIHGTGNPMPDDPGRYLGTFMLHSGALVFHAYEPS